MFLVLTILGTFNYMHLDINLQVLCVDLSRYANIQSAELALMVLECHMSKHMSKPHHVAYLVTSQLSSDRETDLVRHTLLYCC